MSYISATPENVNKAIDIAEFIISDGGHSTAEAGEEFGYSSHQINRYLELLPSEAYYSVKDVQRGKELLVLYKRAKLSLEKTRQKNRFRPTSYKSV